VSNAALLKLLADGNFHSGEDLGGELGVTRAAIWKQLKQLEQLGIVVEASKSNGYRLPVPIILLESERIKQQLSPIAKNNLSSLCVFDRIDSTNSYLMQASREGELAGCVVIAEQQISGRGRRGRIWQSPFACNLYMSVLWRFEGGVAALEGLSLAVGAILIAALKEFGIEGLSLKWPNDLLFGQKKIGGILVEMSGDMSGSCAAVVGIGINVNMPNALGGDIDQPWTDLATIYGKSIDRNELIVVLLNHLLLGLVRFSACGFQAFQESWQQSDALNGLDVAAYQGDEIIVGISRGITSTGALRIETPAGERILSGGEVSLRAQL
jgi:BirA family biotin operon repressor/biotin-[acetyl-CoA-carboxylase] ligase